MPLTTTSSAIRSFYPTYVFAALLPAPAGPPAFPHMHSVPSPPITTCELLVCATFTPHTFPKGAHPLTAQCNEGALRAGKATLTGYTDRAPGASGETGHLNTLRN